MQGSSKYRVLFVVMVTAFLTPFTGSALTLSLPAIGLELGAEASALGWVLEIFLLASIVSLLPMGHLADRVGKRRVLLWGTVLFTAASSAGIFAPNMAALLALRAGQGIGAAMMFATNLSILTLVFPKEERGRAMGWNVAVVYVGLALGPVIGGVMNYYFGWRSIFACTAGIGLVAVLAITCFLRQEWREVPSEGRDLMGTALYGIAVVLTMGGLSELASSPYAPAALGGGLLVFFAFLLRERRLAAPLFPLRLFAGNRAFSLSTLTALLNYCATFAASFLLSIYLQSVLGLTSREAGLMLLLQPVVMAALSPRMGRLSDRYPPARIASLGMGIIAVGLLAVAGTIHLRLLFPLVPVIMWIGAGFACFAAPNNNAIMSAVPKADYSLASSMLVTARHVGQVLSVALVTMMLSLEWGSVEASEALVRNIELAFLVFAGLCVVGTIPSTARGVRDGSAR